MPHHTKELFILIPGVVCMHTQLSLTEKFIYGSMLALSSKSGFCFASQSRLATRCMVPRETVARAIRKFKDLRCIEDWTDRPEALAELSKHGIEPNPKCRIFKCLHRVEKRGPRIVSLPKRLKTAS